jgi:hypothetical protein
MVKYKINKSELIEILDIIWVVFMISIFVFGYLALGYYMMISLDPSIGI